MDKYMVGAPVQGTSKGPWRCARCQSGLDSLLVIKSAGSMTLNCNAGPRLILATPILWKSFKIRLSSFNFMITFSLSPKAWVSLITSLSEIPPRAVPPRQRRYLPLPQDRLSCVRWLPRAQLSSVNMNVRASIDRKIRHPNCFCCGQSSANSFRSNFGWIHLLAVFARVFKINSHYTLVNNCFDTIFKTITIAILLIGAEWFLEFLCNWSDSADSSKVGFKSHIIVFKSCCGCNCTTSGGNGFDGG